MSDKSKSTALLLALFVGIFGGHRFYVGKAGSGLGQLFTLGGLGIWTLIDIVQIIRGQFTDKSGAALSA